jgi:hypothetical protein
MTLAIAAIPDDLEVLPRWLEERIVGGELRELVAELAAVHGTSPPRDSVRGRLATLLPMILANGITALPEVAREKVVQHLLRQPYHLLELQEVVLLEGGAYWDAIPLPKPLKQGVSRGKERIAGKLFGRATEQPSARIGVVEPVRHTDRKGGWYRSTGAAIAATAALVCIGTLAVTHLLAPPATTVAAGTNWGWAKPGGIPAETDRAKYYAALADRGNEWFDERPADAVSLARRLLEFRQGCAVLQLAPHGPLTPQAREDLKAKCRNWAAKFDGYLARVEAGEDPAAVRAEADATVRKLVDTLQAESRKS